MPPAKNSVPKQENKTNKLTVTDSLEKKPQKHTAQQAASIFMLVLYYLHKSSQC